MATFLMSIIQYYIEVMEQPQEFRMGSGVMKTLFCVHFFQRMSFLLPRDGWGVWRYVDFKLYYPKAIFEPFIVRPLLYELSLDRLTEALVVIITLFNVLLLAVVPLITLFQKLKLFDKQNPNGFVKLINYLIFRYVTYLWLLLYLP